MEAILSVLTSKPAALLAWAATVSLAIALSVFAVQKGELRRENATLLNTVGQLKGSLDFQNDAVTRLGTETAAAQKVAKAAQEASGRAHAGDAAAVAALLSQASNSGSVSPMEACIAADKSILDTIK